MDGRWLTTAEYRFNFLIKFEPAYSDHPVTSVRAHLKYFAKVLALVGINKFRDLIFRSTTGSTIL
jgi:hypothetical protein